jgi:glycyl-tRNA synthetase beta chain
VKGYSYDVVNAVLAVGGDDVVDVLSRAEAVKQVMHLPEFQAIGAACKRIRNILRQAEEKNIKFSAGFEYLPDAAEEEKALMAHLESRTAKIEEHRSKKEYLEALLLLSEIREPLDRFFDKVMVMVDDERVRANRLALLRTLLRRFSSIADFSEIVTDNKN